MSKKRTSGKGKDAPRQEREAERPRPEPEPEADPEVREDEPEEQARSAEESSGPEQVRRELAERDARIEQLQRTAAELDNRRKRLERQALEASRYALQDLAMDLLPVIDNFERALGHAEESRDFDALHDGLKLVHDQLLGVLRKYHVEKIEALNEPFDPNHHEAVAQVESGDHPDRTVIDVHQEGYRLHDRTIRPSRVMVSRRAECKENGRENNGEADAQPAPEETGDEADEETAG